MTWLAPGTRRTGRSRSTVTRSAGSARRPPGRRRGHGRVQRFGGRRGRRPVERHGRTDRGRAPHAGPQGGIRRHRLRAPGRVPFESEDKFMATLNRVPTVGPCGSCSRARRIGCSIAARCSGWPTAPSSPLDRPFWEREIEALGRRGCACWPLPCAMSDAGARGLSREDLDQGMVFVGLVGISTHRGRRRSRRSRLCREAGIA
jgi:hypothetical protein